MLITYDVISEMLLVMYGRHDMMMILISHFAMYNSKDLHVVCLWGLGKLVAIKNDTSSLRKAFKVVCTIRSMSHNWCSLQNNIQFSPQFSLTGTPNYPDLETYCEKVSLDKYDTFLIFTANRFTENDLSLAKRVKSIKKSFFFIRTKIDQDYQNEKRKKAFKEEAMLATIMEDCLENLEGLRDGDEVVFLISNHYPAKWDFARLTQVILDVLPFRQRECLTLSLGVFTSFSTDMLKRKAELLRGNFKAMDLQET